MPPSNRIRSERIPPVDPPDPDPTGAEPPERDPLDEIPDREVDPEGGDLIDRILHGGDRDREWDDPRLADRQEAEWRREAERAQRDPHGRTEGRSSRRRDFELKTALLHYGGGDGCVAWSVYRGTDEGREERLGTIHVDAGPLEFVRKFLGSMPRPGEKAVTFFFTPIDVRGQPLEANRYATLDYPPDNVDLVAVRAEQRAVAAEAAAAAVPVQSGESIALQLLREQLKDAQEARRLEAEAAKEERKERERKLEALEAELRNDAKARREDQHTVARSTEEAYSKVLTTQAEIAAAERQRRDEQERTDRIRREEDRKEERERVATERAEERAREERRAALEMKKMELATQERIAEINAKLEAAKLEAAERRAEEALRRAEEKEAAAQARLDQEKRDNAEQARRDAHALSMENIRIAAEQRSQALVDAQRQDQKEHAALVLATLERKEDGPGVVEKVVSIATALGTVATALNIDLKGVGGMVSGLFSGGAGASALVTAIEKIGDIGVEIAKAARRDDDEEEEEEEEEEDGDEAEEVQEPAESEPAAERQAPKVPDFRLPAPEVIPESRQITDTPAGAPVPTATPTGEVPGTAPVPTIGVLPVIPLPEQRAGREAVRALWESVKTRPVAEWPAIVKTASNVPAFVTFVSKTGLDHALGEVTVALAPADRVAAANAMAEALTPTGWFGFGGVPRGIPVSTMPPMPPKRARVPAPLTVVK